MAHKIEKLLILKRILTITSLQKLATNRQLPALCYTLSSTSHDISHTLPTCSIAIRNYSSTSTNQPTTDHEKAGNLDDFRAREEKKEEAFNKEYKATDHQDSGPDGGEDAAAKEVKMKILEAALPFVGEHGWTRQALTKGAEHINYPGVAHGIFPKGGFELIQYFFTKCNRALVEEMRRETDGIEKVANPSEFAEKAIRIRLQMLEPYLATWPQALGMMSLPPNAPSAIANMLTLADDICYYAGDRSVDFNWYTRRIGLASIYKATELYMLQDSSINHEKTWQFLQRRIVDGYAIHEMLMHTEEASHHLQQAVETVFITARNILGANFSRR